MSEGLMLKVEHYKTIVRHLIYNIPCMLKMDIGQLYPHVRSQIQGVKSHLRVKAAPSTNSKGLNALCLR